VLSYLPVIDHASPAALSAGMIAVRAVDLQARAVGLAGERGAVPAGALAEPGTPVMFCQPVVTVPAVIRGGRVLAGGWLPDFVWLGELERHLGEGVIEELVAAATAGGRLPVQQRRRLMSFPLVIRLMVAMTLMPDASYCEALRRLAGLLAAVPFAQEWHVPTEKVVTAWRRPVPASLMEDLFWRAAGPLIPRGLPSAVMLAGMPVCGIDGSLVNVADTRQNRKAFGCSGTKNQHGAEAAPFPQLQAVLVTARAGRATLGAICGRARAGEQALLARLIRRRQGLFARRAFASGRNFPGHTIITTILGAGGHVVARIKAGISLPDTGQWLPDGSRISYLNAPSGQPEERIAVRVCEHNAVLPCGGGQVSETCTLATTILDHQAAPADAVRDAYLARQSASETTFGEDKTTITGAGGPHQRAGAAVGLPAPGHPGVLGLADRHPASARQRGGRTGQQRGRRPRAAPPRGRRAGHRRPSLLHRRPPPGDPVDDMVPGHCGRVPGRARRRGRRRRQVRAAHPDHHRTAPPLRARSEGPAEVPAHRSHQEDRYRHPADHRVRAQPAVSRRASRNTRKGRRKPPRQAGPAARGTAHRPQRHAGPVHAPGQATRRRTGHQPLSGVTRKTSPRPEQTPKVPGVGPTTGSAGTRTYAEVGISGRFRRARARRPGRRRNPARPDR